MGLIKNPLTSSGKPFPISFPVPSVRFPLLDTVAVIDCVEISLLSMGENGCVDCVHDDQNGHRNGKKNPVGHGVISFRPGMLHAAFLGIKKPPEGGCWLRVALFVAVIKLKLDADAGFYNVNIGAGWMDVVCVELIKVKLGREIV